MIVDAQVKYSVQFAQCFRLTYVPFAPDITSSYLSVISQQRQLMSTKSVKTMKDPF